LGDLKFGNFQAMGKFWLGCAVWSYKGWVGDFYPHRSHSREFLSLYSQRLNAVEGNTTFYAVPDEKTIQKWVSQTPPEFKFCPKFPKEITHQGQLQGNLESAYYFIERMRGLGSRLGVIFAQLPPRYSPAYLEDLILFLQALPQDIDYAVEVRHPDWFQEPFSTQLNQALRTLKVGKVLLDTRPIYNATDDPQGDSKRKKPQLPLQITTTTHFSLIRFISHPHGAENQRYLDEWVIQLRQWLHQGREIYFFVHCPQEVYSPQNAYRFYQELQQQDLDLPILPWERVTGISQQLSLFE
jgi:uncharacterized protein YecE (DUF72 family)